MSTYVISDIHGDAERFHAMVKLLRLTPNDTLYILGDVIDRGEDGISLLTEIMKDPRMKLLLGNHEYMLLQYFSPDATEKDRRRWNRNRNYYTLQGLDALSDSERESLFTYLKSLPDSVRLSVKGKSFCLVHGFPGNDTHDRVWNRPELDTPSPLEESCRLVIGHTPVSEYVCPGGEEDMYVYSRVLTLKKDHFRILHADGFTNIDCCCGYPLSAARLACLRLEDGAEFYV